MDESIYGNINADETFETDQPQTTDASADTRKKTSQHTGSECVKNRSLSSVVVCLVVLCVLLLTAVIVLCVLIYTNNHHINNKNITQENQTDDQLLLKYVNLTIKKDGLFDSSTHKTQDNQLTQQINKLWRILNETDGWTYYHFSFYYISSKKKSWSESRRYCRERGADLIIINNKEEQDFAVEVTHDYGVWIGLSDSDVEGKWKWVDNSTMTSGFWKSGEDTRHRKENCAASYSSGWYNYACSVAFKWMCERKMKHVLNKLLNEKHVHSGN